ncbi:MAG: NFACT RNA binding domain-containing protein [Bdellovibrionota bacterium]
MYQNSTNIDELAPWTKKFAPVFSRLQDTALQKISATESGELVLSVYKPKDDRSHVVLSMKKGESGASLTQTRPVTLKQPNSFLQITRKYLQGRKILAAYVSISPICIILEFVDHVSSNETIPGPNSLILDLDAKPPRLLLTQKTIGTPERYEKECGKNFTAQDAFFESWCEWSSENTKTKRRASFLFPLVGYCPMLEEVHCVAPVVPPKLASSSQNDTLFTHLPTHIRKSVRTKLQFLERRLQRQKFDLPTEQQLEKLKKQSEGLKNVLYLWPKDSLSWHVPSEFIEEYGLNPIYSLKKFEKPSTILTNLYREIDIFERRKIELSKRIQESENSLKNFQNLVVESVNQLLISKNEATSLQQLCKYLDIAVVKSEQIKKLKLEKEERLPYKIYTSSTGQFIRVARSAADGENMLKKMPSNHYWLHVLTGEGSHVWLEKMKGEKKLNPIALREAGILAVHHSKQSRSQNAEVQFATRADIEKKKNLPPGKVLVRRCETFMIRYDTTELKKIIEGEMP